VFGYLLLVRNVARNLYSSVLRADGHDRPFRDPLLPLANVGLLSARIALLACFIASRAPGTGQCHKGF